MTDRSTAKVRGIYSTALTRLFLEADWEVVQASKPIRRRFDTTFEDAPAAVRVDTTGDRQGVGATGDPDAVAAATDLLSGVGRDALAYADPAPAGAVFDARVTKTLGGGAVVDLGDREGYLPYDAADDYLDPYDELRVQVRESAPPWADDRPELGTDLRVGGGLVTLRRGESGVSVAADRERTTELARTTELLSADPPDGWGIRWERDAVDADMDAMGTALSAATDRARDLEARLDARDDGDGERPRRVAAPLAGRWVWFGRESRFALDAVREEVTDTMAGHHRTKTASRRASAAVDFVEAVCGGGEEFPFAAVTDQFGPAEGDRVRIDHGKPDGRLITLGRASVEAVDPEGKVRLRREMRSSGTYDGLGTRREAGDVAVTRIKEGRWWYPTVYKGEDDAAKGTYVNVCTPVEVFPDAVRYVDLHVDVVKRPDGAIERVDDDELDRAVEDGHVPAELAGKAREVAGSIEDAL